MKEIIRNLLHNLRRKEALKSITKAREARKMLDGQRAALLKAHQQLAAFRCDEDLPLLHHVARQLGIVILMTKTQRLKTVIDPKRRDSVVILSAFAAEGTASKDPTQILVRPLYDKSPFKDKEEN